MPKLAVVSLGCAKNLVDTEIMLGQLAGEGWEVTRDFAEAELILINTCGFIEEAKAESIRNILELSEYKKPDRGSCRKLVVAGCLVERYPQELVKELPEVDHWIGLGEIGRIADLIREKPSGPKVGGTPYLNDENLPRYQVTLSHTAYVKIAEGCNHRCAYCAIPGIKGRFRSRRPESVVREITRLVEAGVREINLIAQDITMYGRDLPEKIDLRKLLERIVTQAKPSWIRLLYAYPSGISRDLLEFIAAEPTICKYLDLPLQHINGRILKLMRRSDPPERIRELLAMIREVVPELTLRTTLIVGFPTETEAEFREMLDFVNEGHFQHLGVFTYSREEGTPAYDYEPQIPEEVKAERKQRLLAAQQPVSARFLAKLVGRELPILIDRVTPDGGAIGRTASLAPDVDGVVYLENYRGKPGEIRLGLITGSDAYNLYAGLD